MVADATVIVAALIHKGATGAWAEDALARAPLHAPELARVETVNVLRRLERRRLTADEATHEDFMDLGFELYPFEPFAERIWELRHSVTCSDAWYVALAEALNVPLATLDARPARAKGPSCQFLTPGPYRVNEAP